MELGMDAAGCGMRDAGDGMRDAGYGMRDGGLSRHWNCTIQALEHRRRVDRQQQEHDRRYSAHGGMIFNRNARLKLGIFFIVLYRPAKIPFYGTNPFFTV
jgi:hypothetical protein